MSKYTEIKELYNEALEHVTESRESLNRFLRAAGPLYEHSFKDQVLVYEQRPEASYLKRFDDWQDMGFWVMKGAKGIAVLREENGRNRVDYFFDVRNVYDNLFVDKDSLVWHVDPASVSYLKRNFGGLGIESLIEEDAGFAFEDFRERFEGQGDGLYELSDEEINTLRRFVISAVKSSVLSKAYDTAALQAAAGYEATELDEAGFEVFRRLTQEQQAEVLGFVSEENNYFLTNLRNYVVENEYTFENGRFEDGTELSESGRLRDSSGDGEHRTERDTREVRLSPDELSERGEAGNIQSLSDDRNTETALSGNREQRAGAGGRYGGEAGEDARSERGSEEAGSDEVGRNDEHVQEPGGRDRNERSDLSLKTGEYSSEAKQAPEDGFDFDSEAYRALHEADMPESENETETEGLSEEEPSEAEVKTEESEGFSVERNREISGTPVNYVISDEALGTGGAKEKYRRNIAAIRLLRRLEEENRYAIPEEQDVLAGYVGWGGLADAFDETKSNWQNECRELKELLSAEEYESARASTLNAHYTSPAIIETIYKALKQFGLKDGTLLEPAMGTGNFFGMLPGDMKNTRLFGVELDSISGRIAQKLYPLANIQVKGYEEAVLSNSFFDGAIGNVPFGNYQVADKNYDHLHMQIHDYFFAKTLDKVRPGGIVAFITSKGTLDKSNSAVREYIAQRAELLGAVRLPNDAFQANAGTSVTSDILFLKKRDRVIEKSMLKDIMDENNEPEWIDLDEDDNGLVYNEYFVNYPENVLGVMKEVTGPFGMELTCEPDQDIPFKKQLDNVLKWLPEDVYTADKLIDEEMSDQCIPADPDVRNFSYTLVDGRIYFRSDSLMYPFNGKDNMIPRIKGMMEIRDCVKELIDIQLKEFEGDSEFTAEFHKAQEKLNQLYDEFFEKYGPLNSQTNKRAFDKDSSYFLLSSLEVIDEEGKYKEKAEMFYKRTIRRPEVVEHCDTSSEALSVSLSEKGIVDLEYMSGLTGKEPDEITADLFGVIYNDPESKQWITSDEYLSGNVREKLRIARDAAENDPLYAGNVKGLELVQPEELDATQISARIGANWIDKKYYVDFIREVFGKKWFSEDDLQYAPETGTWIAEGSKNRWHSTYGEEGKYATDRVSAMRIFEDSMNLKEVKVYDTNHDYRTGKDTRVLNQKETILASQKQEMLREEFKNWIFRDPERRKALVEKYNVLFNSVRPRQYDGEHLKFPGMSPEIELLPHQKNAIAHILYGDNTLLAHCVGAGKTFEMAAAAMELKRLGLCQKPMFVVPSHLTEQWASEFLRLYPGAKVLAATAKDFKPENRKRFCSRIATGEYDAVILGFTQFEKIPISKARQEWLIKDQIEEITNQIASTGNSWKKRATVKELEKTKRSLETKLKKLNESKRDDAVTFEQLGVDRLFVDESHNYKNLFLYTKMRNISGIAQTEAQKSTDMYNKCKYMDEITGGTGTVFATGTPISNSMTELYTNMRYLQASRLKEMGLELFDSWAAAFGETINSIELAPEGTGFRSKTRFAKFFNLPELMSIFKECADIQTADTLNLPVPEADYENVVLQPSEFQKELIQELGVRAEKIRNGGVDPRLDNMLNITNDGRKLALDQRLIDPSLPDDPCSKVNTCVENAVKIYEDTKKEHSAQVIFCDLSTPKTDGTFSVYNDIAEKLQARGVAADEIAFIHDAKTEKQKDDLFAKVRSGKVRFILGSTAKMGTGTNIQKKLVALHHLDVPWRPSDIEQQEGRILRQGNENERVKIYRYITEGTFDAYSWQIIENKQKFIGQIMTSKSPVRSCDDVDDTALSYAEVKALATGDERIKEKMTLETEVAKLKLLRSNHISEQFKMEDDISTHLPKKIKFTEEKIDHIEKDIIIYHTKYDEWKSETETKAAVNETLPIRNDGTERTEEKDRVRVTVGSTIYVDRSKAGIALMDAYRKMPLNEGRQILGEYMGLKICGDFDINSGRTYMTLKGNVGYPVRSYEKPAFVIKEIERVAAGINERLAVEKQNLEQLNERLKYCKAEVGKPFAKEDEYQTKCARLAELDIELNMDEKVNEVFDEKDDTELPEEMTLEGKLSLAASRVTAPDYSSGNIYTNER